MKGIINGAFSYIKAFEIIGRYNLWIYFIAPALVSIVLGIAILGTAYGISGNIGDWLIGLYPWEWGRSVLEKIASVFGAIFVIAIGLIIFRQLVIALASPFMSPMSEKIEARIRGKKKEIPFTVSQFFSDLVRGLTIALRNIIRELFFTFLLFLLGLIPLFAPFTAILIFVVQSYYAGFGNMDFTLERHFRVRGSVRFVRRHWGLAIGNGAIFLLLLLTGIGFLFAIPLGAAAATSETVKRLEKESAYS